MWPSEKRFAKLLTRQNRKWQYPTKRFRLKDTTYQPDFFLPKENLYYEVINSSISYYQHKKQICELRKIRPKIHLIIVNPDGVPIEKIASRMRKSIATILRWFNGETKPRFAELKLLNQIYRGYKSKSERN